MSELDGRVASDYGKYKPMCIEHYSSALGIDNAWYNVKEVVGAGYVSKCILVPLSVNDVGIRFWIDDVLVVSHMSNGNYAIGFINEKFLLSSHLNERALIRIPGSADLCEKIGYIVDYPSVGVTNGIVVGCQDIFYTHNFKVDLFGPLGVHVCYAILGGVS